MTTAAVDTVKAAEAAEAYVGKWAELETDAGEPGALTAEQAAPLWDEGLKLVQAVGHLQTAAQNAGRTEEKWKMGGLRGRVETVLDRLDRLSRSRKEYADWEAKKAAAKKS